ncbi:unnamed protein product [Urochloa decumbens]|uniref:Uncharacterized protein n=1 Tax=Urochloa decumbens TaxID=240449 RepID=A0ABC9DER0_9POAL
MGNSISATAAVPALCTAIGALELANHLDATQRTGAGAAAAHQAPPPLGTAARAFLPVAAAGCLCASVAQLHRQLRRRACSAEGAADRRLPWHVAFATLCASAGFLQLLLFVAPGGPGGVADRAAARAVGLAALGGVPAVSAVSFFLGMLLIIVGHIRAGGEGGGGAVAGEGPIEAPVVRILANAATASTAVLLCLTAIAVCFTM